MALEVLRAAGVGRDLALIFDFLVVAAEYFGESAETAFDMAERRLVEVEAAMLDLGKATHQGTLRRDLGNEYATSPRVARCSTLLSSTAPKLCVFPLWSSAARTTWHGFCSGC